MAKRPPPISGKTYGNNPIFRNKEGGDRLQGTITPAGSTRFEHARKRLAKLVDRETEGVSDADTIEYLARGETETLKYLKENPL